MNPGCLAKSSLERRNHAMNSSSFPAFREGNWIRFTKRPSIPFPAVPPSFRASGWGVLITRNTSRPADSFLMLMAEFRGTRRRFPASNFIVSAPTAKVPSPETTWRVTLEFARCSGTNCPASRQTWLISRKGSSIRLAIPRPSFLKASFSFRLIRSMLCTPFVMPCYGTSGGISPVQDSSIRAKFVRTSGPSGFTTTVSSTRTPQGPV